MIVGNTSHEAILGPLIDGSTEAMCKSVRYFEAYRTYYDDAALSFFYCTYITLSLFSSFPGKSSGNHLSIHLYIHLICTILQLHHPHLVFDLGTAPETKPGVTPTVGTNINLSWFTHWGSAYVSVIICNLYIFRYMYLVFLYMYLFVGICKHIFICMYTNKYIYIYKWI